MSTLEDELMRQWAEGVVAGAETAIRGIEAVIVEQESRGATCLPHNVLRAALGALRVGAQDVASEFKK